MLFALKAMLMSVLPFYRAELPRLELPPQIEMEEVVPQKEPIKTTLNNKDKAYSDLQLFLSQETSGWKYDIVTYAPKRTFRWAGVSINCLRDGAVVNYKQEGDSVMTQVSKAKVEHPCFKE